MQHVPEKGGRSEVLGIYLIFFFNFVISLVHFFHKNIIFYLPIFIANMTIISYIFNTLLSSWYFYYFIHGNIVNKFEFPFLRLLFKQRNQ